MRVRHLALAACTLAIAGAAPSVDFTVNPTSATIVTQQEMADATAPFGGSAIAGNMNTRGIALLEGANPADERMVIWMEDEIAGTDPAFFLLFDPNVADPTDSDLTVIGGGILNDFYCEGIAPPYGTFAAANGIVSWQEDRDSGDFFAIDASSTMPPMSPFPSFTDRAAQRIGAIDHIMGDLWIAGATSDLANDDLDGLVYTLDYAVGDDILPSALTFTDVRDLDVFPNGSGGFDALVADRANDTVHLVTDVLGAQADGGDITPASIAGTVGIQGLVALDRNTYFLYDELYPPNNSFGDDALIVVRNDSVVAEHSWNDIAAAGAGIGEDGLSVNFHNGIAVRSADPTLVEVYLTNFGGFGSQQLVRVPFTGADAASIDYSTLSSATVVTQAELSAVTLEAEGDCNALGVSYDPTTDRMVLWMDGTGGNSYYISWDATIADPVPADMRLIGGDSLENIYGGPHAVSYGTLGADDGVVTWMNNATSDWFVLPDSEFAPCASLLVPYAGDMTLADDSGAIDYIADGKWLYGRTNQDQGMGEVGIVDYEPGEAELLLSGGNPIDINDIRDINVVDGPGGTKDALVLDRLNDQVNLITDLTGTTVWQGIVPVTGLPSPVGLQGLATLDRNLYFLYDELFAPNDSFGDDALIVVQNDDVKNILSWNDIGSLGAGIGTDALSVDFHNGLDARQPDANTVEVYLSNFGNFASQQIVKVTWVDASNVDTWKQYD